MAGMSGFADEARERARQDRERQTASGSTSYPDWMCKNCHRKYPEDTEATYCERKADGSRCGGTLVRWQNYEEKVR